MRGASATTSATQLRLAGMPPPERTGAATTFENLSPGQVVQYMGKVSGGPRHGATGLVRQASGRRAVVDLGRSGTWHIPYYFLAIPPRAA